MTNLESAVLKNIVEASGGDTKKPITFLQYGVPGKGEGDVGSAIQELAKLGYIRRPGQPLGTVYVTELGKVHE